jgi:uncharacterized membrane protein
MADRMRPAKNTKLNLILTWAAFGLAILGVLDSIYLFIYKLTNLNALCLGNGGCHDVNFSPYSEIGGIPVSVFGIAAYLVIAIILLMERRFKPAREYGNLAVFGLSLAGLAFSVYLTWLEIYIIHALCPFCLASAVLICLIFILAMIRLFTQSTI